MFQQRRDFIKALRMARNDQPLQPSFHRIFHLGLHLGIHYAFSSCLNRCIGLWRLIWLKYFCFEYFQPLRLFPFAAAGQHHDGAGVCISASASTSSTGRSTPALTLRQLLGLGLNIKLDVADNCFDRRTQRPQTLGIGIGLRPDGAQGAIGWLGQGRNLERALQ